MNADDKRTTMVERVRAMFAKAASSEYDAEREVFEAKALRIMAEYSIEERELRDAGPHEPSTYDFDSFGNARYGAVALAIWTHEIFGSYGVTFGPGKARIVGTASAKEQADMLVDHLLPQLRHDLTVHKPRSRKSFALGWASRVTDRIRVLQAEAYSGGNALVPTNIEAKRAYEEEFGKAGNGRRTQSSYTDAAAGRSAASHADLNQRKVTA